MESYYGVSGLANELYCLTKEPNFIFIEELIKYHDRVYEYLF